MLLFLLTLFIGNSCFSSAESESVTSLISGIDEVSEALVEDSDRCSPDPLSEKLEENVSWLEGLLERQWEMLNRSGEFVENATKRAQEQVNHYYAALPTDAPEACAEPFKSAAGSCFWAHKNPGLSWKRARARCQQAGADLATPQDVPGVVEFLKTELGSEPAYVWFGGKQERAGEWKWLKRDMIMDIDPSHWLEDSHQGRCASFDGGREYKIVGKRCGNEIWFLCEKNIES